MTSTAPQPIIAFSVRTASVVLLPGEKFFVRRIPLTPGQDAAVQVELALETFGPFAPAQIFHGFCPSRDGKQAVLFAAYRKNFTAEEISSWAKADLVLPEFALWLALATPPAAGAWLYENDEALQLIAWDGGELPAGLLFRKTDNITGNATESELLEEAARRFGVPTDSPRRLSGNFAIDRWSKEGLGLKLDKPGQTMAALVPVAVARSMDVRDKAELASLAQLQKRENWLWRSFGGIAAALILCAVLELGLQVAGKVQENRQQVVKDNAVAVHKIEQANTLAARMEQMAGQRMKPLEMLNVMAANAPKSMTFPQVTITSPTQIEVNAEVGNAADMRDYEPALRKTPGVEKVEVTNQRLLPSGTTTFNLKVVFKPAFAADEERK